MTAESRRGRLLFVGCGGRSGLAGAVSSPPLCQAGGDHLEDR